MAKKSASVPETTPESAETPSKHPILEGLEAENASETPPTAETEAPEDEAAVETPEEGAEEASEEPDSGESASESAFLDQVKEMGYAGDDEHEAAVQLLESYRALMEEREIHQRRMQELEELSEYGSRYLREQREREQPKQPEQPAEQASQPDKWWSPPEFDPKWLEQYRDVKMGEDGQPQIGWKDSTPREVRQAAEAYQQYLEQWATDLVQRPQEVLPKVIEQEFDRLFQERIQQRDEQTRVQTLAEQIKETNKDWMYTTDSQGREVLTEQGQVMTGLLNQVSESGVTDPAAQWQYAVAMYDYLNRAQRPAAAPTETPQQVAEQKRRRQLQRGIPQGVGNRSGTVPRPEDDEPTRAQNPHLSPGRQLLDQLRRDGEI